MLTFQGYNDGWQMERSTLEGILWDRPSSYLTLLADVLRSDACMAYFWWTDGTRGVSRPVTLGLVHGPSTRGRDESFNNSLL